MITAIEGTSIAVEFDKAGSKKMGYEFCMEKKCWNLFRKYKEGEYQ